MSTVTTDNIQHAPPTHREAMSRDELLALAERTTQTLLGVPAEEGLRMLEAGDLDGQGVETPLRGIKRLLDR